jgi:hypothetical protein
MAHCKPYGAIDDAGRPQATMTGIGSIGEQTVRNMANRPHGYSVGMKRSAQHEEIATVYPRGAGDGCGVRMLCDDRGSPRLAMRFKSQARLRRGGV